MSRRRGILALELVLVLPVSVVLLPLLAAGSVGLMIALAQWAWAGDWLIVRGLGAHLGAPMLAGGAGLFALWTTLLSGESIERTAGWGVRAILAAGLGVGIAAAAWWLWTIRADLASDLPTRWTWLLMLGGPMLVAARRLGALLFGWRRS
jgi:hypothetical protein